MAWSYNSSDLTPTTDAGRLNIVRLLIGDTNTTDQQLQDSEITFALSQNGNNTYSAAYWACNALVSKYARLVNTQLDGALKSDYSDLMQHYLLLASSLEYQGKSSGASLGVRAGGITKVSIEAARADTNRIEGSFRRDQFKNPPSYNTPEYE
jgi:hypothetical protein